MKTRLDMIGKAEITILLKDTEHRYEMPIEHYNKIKHQLNNLIMDNPDQEEGERPERPDDDDKG